MDSRDAKGTQAERAVERLVSGATAGLVVRELMTARPCCVEPETTALDLVRRFHAKGFRHLLVTDPAGRLLGVISDRDVLRCLGPEKRPNQEALAQLRADELMSTDLVTVSPETPVERAAGLIVEQGISCLPVVSGGTLKGILTNTDLHIALGRLLQALKRSRAAEAANPAACDLHN